MISSSLNICTHERKSAIIPDTVVIKPIFKSVCNIESGIDCKAKAAVKKTAKDYSRLAVVVQDKVKENVDKMVKIAPKRGKKS